MRSCSMELQPKQINARYKKHFGEIFEEKFLLKKMSPLKIRGQKSGFPDMPSKSCQLY